jgi:pyridoxamine 5'-phosphate oxidase
MTAPTPSVPDVAAMRRQYNLGALHESELNADPIAQFTAWFRDAVSAQIVDPSAMSLATAGSDGRPLVRSVLLKNYDARGFVFYTNLESRKARQLKENPQAALLFPWLLLERQVIITGAVERLSTVDAVKYFVTRPRDSQLSAWASQQSAPISSRQMLEMEWAAVKRKFSAGEVPMPDFWGGFRVVPDSLEFWQGGANRLHDRIQYTRDGAKGWKMGRLAP